MSIRYYTTRNRAKLMKTKSINNTDSGSSRRVKPARSFPSMSLLIDASSVQQHLSPMQQLFTSR